MPLEAHNLLAPSFCRGWPVSRGYDLAETVKGVSFQDGLLLDRTKYTSINGYILAKGRYSGQPCIFRSFATEARGRNSTNCRQLSLRLSCFRFHGLELIENLIFQSRPGPGFLSYLPLIYRDLSTY